MNNKISILLILGCLAIISSARAQQQADGDQALPVFSNVYPLSNVLVDAENVICYERTGRQLYHLSIKGNLASVRRVFSMPRRSSDRLSVWDLAAQKDDAGNILVSWQNDESSNETGARKSIQLLYLGLDGNIEHHLVKQFPKSIPFFDLRMFVVNSGSVQFFYTHYSEKYFSPIQDTGSIQKLWTLGWRDKKVVFDVQLSKEGTEHSTGYDAAYRGNGIFDLAWTEQRIGSFFGARKRFKIGTVLDDKGSPRLRELAAVPIDAWEADDKTVVPIVAQSADGTFGALAEIRAGIKGSAFTKIAANGKVDGEIQVQGKEITQAGYDSKTGLLRYVKGGLLGFVKVPPIIKAELHWTDLRGREWVEQLELPSNAIQLIQKAGDCFYWLQPGGGNFELRKKCRQAG